MDKNLSGVTLTPRFIFGSNGSIRNNLYVIDDNKVMYVAGHNVILYNIDEKSQYFIPGSEITEGINHIAVSHKSQLLAICERSKKAQLTIYNLI